MSTEAQNAQMQRKELELTIMLAAPKKKKTFICPYEECKKVFGESGNLKRHLRSHVCPSP